MSPSIKRAPEQLMNSRAASGFLLACLLAGAALLLSLLPLTSSPAVILTHNLKDCHQFHNSDHHHPASVFRAACYSYLDNLNAKVLTPIGLAHATQSHSAAADESA